MTNIFPSLLLGAVAGLIASAAMNAFQSVAAGPLGQTSDDDPATVKLADKLSLALTGTPVAESRRVLAGQVVHYTTGVGLGVLYVVLAADLPLITLWYGVAYGIAVAILLDYIAVPALGVGAPAWQTPPATHAFGLLSHALFGAALEGVRQIGRLLP